MKEMYKQTFSCSVTYVDLMSSLDKPLTGTNTDNLTELLQGPCGSYLPAGLQLQPQQRMIWHHHSSKLHHILTESTDSLTASLQSL